MENSCKEEQKEHMHRSALLKLNSGRFGVPQNLALTSKVQPERMRNLGKAERGKFSRLCSFCGCLNASTRAREPRDDAKRRGEERLMNGASGEGHVVRLGKDVLKCEEPL
jgi:hypothetical protein